VRAHPHDFDVLHAPLEDITMHAESEEPSTPTRTDGEVYVRIVDELNLLYGTCSSRADAAGRERFSIG
jgi:hypothetical protein